MVSIWDLHLPLCHVMVDEGFNPLLPPGIFKLLPRLKITDMVTLGVEGITEENVEHKVLPVISSD